MIPSRKEAKPIILDVMSDAERHSSEELQKMIAAHFALTPEERVQKRGKGPHPEYVNETAFALVELQQDGLIKKLDPNRFVYRITDSGQDAARRRLLGTPIPPRSSR